MKELTLPPVISDAERAMELARVWIADNRPTFVLSGNLWDNPATWGVLLVDLLHHISSAYAAQGADQAEVLELIKDAFYAEIDNRTD